MMEMRDLLDQIGVGFVSEGNSLARSGWLQMDCPFCASHGKYHLGYNIFGGYFNCWKCGGHSAFRTITAFIGGDSKKASGLLKGIVLPEGGEAIKERAAKVVLPKHLKPLQTAHRRYLRGRGFNPTELEIEWALQGIGISHPASMSWRIFVPITYQGGLVSWVCRAISPNAQRRYIAASAEQESMNNKHVVYGLDKCWDTVVIVEGVTDVWNIGIGAAATLGIDFKPEQVLQLSKIPNRFVCYDSSKSAQRQADKLCEQLAMFDGNTTNIVLDAEDPGSATKKEIAKLRKAARL